MAPAPASQGHFADLRLRVISAAVLMPVGLVVLWAGGMAWLIMIAAMALGMVYELACLQRHRPSTLVFASMLAYTLTAAASLAWLRTAPQVGLGNVLFVLLVVWASDIGAYIFGRLIGGPRLAPLISPGKTWSGALGGLASALAIGWGAVLLDPGSLSGSKNVVHAVLVAGCLGIVSQAGDLLESGLKRHFGVKDSGRLIPGHGGLLDRLDGLLAAAMAAGALALFLGRGAVLWQ